MATPTSMFGMSPLDVMEQRIQQQAQENASRRAAQSAAGQSLGIFNPLYQAGLGFSDMAGQAARSLFGAQDPMLMKAAQIQQAMAGKDMNKPEDMIAFSQELAKMGYTAEAMQVAQQARTAGLEERRLSIQEEQLLLQQVDKDPYGSIERAMALPDTDPRKQIIITGASAKIGEKNTAEAMRMAEAEKTTAQTALARAQLGQVGAGSVSESVATEDGKPLEKRGGKFYTMDGKVYTGPIKRLSSTEDLLSRIGKLEDGGEGGAAGGKKTLTDAEVRARLRGEKPPTSPTPTVPSRSATDRVPPRPPDSFNGVRNPEAATWDRLYSATHNRNGTPK